MKQPEFLYFDLGRVLVNFDHERAVQQLAAIATCGEDEVRKIVFETPLQADYERGRITTQTFCDYFRAESGATESDETISNAASDIFWTNESMLPLIASLRASGNSIGILSNTCDAHWEFILRKNYPIIGQFDLDSDPVVLSYKVGAAKPQAAIYQFAIERAGVAPSGIFFVDDLQANVDGACDAGIDAVLYTTTEQLMVDLQARGLKT